MWTYSELKVKAKDLYPGVILEKYSNHFGRNKFRTILFWFLVISFLVAVYSTNANAWYPSEFSITLENYTQNFRGLFFVIFSIWFSFYLLEAYYLSYYFRESTVDFETTKLVFLSDQNDLTKSLLDSEIGKYIILRLGISVREINNFLKSRSTVLSTKYIEFINKRNQQFTLADYALAIYNSDDSFQEFLNQRGVTEEIFRGAIKWVNRNQKEIIENERWWSKDSLARIPSIGSNWSFGKTYLLDKYGHLISEDSIYRSLGDKWRIFKRQVSLIEKTLVRERGANAMVISSTNEIGMSIVSALGKMIFDGKILPELEDRRIYVLNHSSLIKETGTKYKFERELNKILNQASIAGNVILVIPDFSEFIENAHEVSVSVAGLLSQFLSSSQIHIVAVSNNRGFHETIETNRDLMGNFEKILINDVDQSMGEIILEDETYRLEQKYSVIFTYQAIKTIMESADRFFNDGTFSDKIVDLIEEVAIKSKNDRRKIIDRESVLDVVSLKTGMPQGNIKKEERSSLESLEKILHQRVVGQNEAINSIASAMRRSRAGMTNPKRPVGSFLFLGPTGVGKTETTKALAENFFKSEDKIIRMDMSEYTGGGAVDKLIGSPDGTVGVLARKIRDQQYGVLLLDEFEKTTEEVKDLFLQIIDEGNFTDGRGEKINTRNLIIIATSNAGSDLIFESTLHGGNLANNKEEIVNEIIRRGIFKPELVNRFDGVILFHSLNRDHLRKIVGLMLDKLNKRLSDKGIKVNVNPELVDYLVEIGNNPQFGARAINRTIQNEVEDLIADKIISGEISDGDNLSFSVGNDNRLIIKKSNKILN